MKDFIAEFQSQHCEPLTNRLIIKTMRNFDEDKNVKSFIAAMEHVINNVAQLQGKTELPLAAHLVVSVMYTNVYFGESKLRLDFYGSGWPIDEAFYSEYIDADWLFTYWPSYKDALTAAAHNQRTWVRSTHLESLHWKAVEQLAYSLYAKLKYWLQDFAASPALGALKREEQFYLLFGEYQDWSKIVFAMLPPIDLCNCESDDFLRFRNHEKRRYYSKTFIDLDLSSSRFQDCTFKNCHFIDMDLSDVVFINCYFSDTTFTNVRLSGTLFSHTTLQDIQFRDVQAELISHDNKDIYRSLAFVDSRLNHMVLLNCCFPYAFLTDSQQTDIKIEGGHYTGSDFGELLAQQVMEGGDS